MARKATDTPDMGGHHMVRKNGEQRAEIVENLTQLTKKRGFVPPAIYRKTGENITPEMNWCPTSFILKMRSSGNFLAMGAMQTNVMEFAQGLVRIMKPWNNMIKLVI